MRKRRTRNHIIEDLGFNHIERHILYAGYTMYRYNANEYSYDGSIHTFSNTGDFENVGILFQLKSTDNPKYSSEKKSISFDLSKKDLESWLLNYFMVVLIVYDAQSEQAYYVDLQDYFKINTISLQNIRKFVRINLPCNQVLNTKTVSQLREKKNERYFGNI
jgi:hypothetical protein